MLEYLKLENVGPAPRMEVEFAPRVNLITGDNGLGKSFLLDTAWRALTGRWPAEVNRRMASGLPARPTDRKKQATIWSRVQGRSGPVRLRRALSGGGRSVDSDAWAHPYTRRRHIRARGRLAVRCGTRFATIRRGGMAAEKHERRPPYVFTETEVWDGLTGELDGRPVPVCKGLLDDWSSWIKAGDANADAMTLKHCARCRRMRSRARRSCRDSRCACQSTMFGTFLPSRRGMPEPYRFCTRRRGSVAWLRSPTC